jgi:hypothetical protein
MHGKKATIGTYALVYNHNDYYQKSILNFFSEQGFRPLNKRPKSCNQRSCIATITNDSQVEPSARSSSAAHIRGRENLRSARVES